MQNGYNDHLFPLLKLFMKYLLLGLTLLALTGCEPGGRDAALLQHNQGVDGCRLAQGCVARGDARPPIVRLSTDDVEAETPFTLSLSFEQPVEDLQARIEGVTMFMGYIPLLFQRDGQQYRATASVGACLTDKMDWRVAISWREADGMHRAYVDFSVFR